MDTNTQQAIYIAVNLFIFIALLTVALTLLTSTLRISTRAGEIISDSSASYVSVISKDLEEGYVYTYEDLLSIYAKNVNNNKKISQYKVSFFVSNNKPDKVYSLLEYIEHSSAQPDKKFALKVREYVENGKTKIEYVFKAK